VVKTIVASFDAYPTARRVVRELMDDGYMSRDIGIVASNVAGDYRVAEDLEPKDTSPAATGALTGGVVGGAAGLAACFLALAIPGIGPIVAAGLVSLGSRSSATR
jgi:hypothetical protein